MIIKLMLMLTGSTPLFYTQQAPLL